MNPDRVAQTILGQHPNAIKARQRLESVIYDQLRLDASVGRSKQFNGERVPLCSLSQDQLRALARASAVESLARAEFDRSQRQRRTAR